MENNILVRKNENLILHFFYQIGLGLCCREYPANPRGEFEVILKDVQNDFDLDLDADLNIHIACQDSAGTILHLVNSNNQWRKFELLKSKSQRVEKKYFRLINVNGWLNLFYILPHEGRHILVHHVPQHPGYEPEVLDYMKISNLPYSVFTDESSNIYCFYQSEKDEINMRTFIWSEKKWSQSTVVAKSSTYCINPSSIVDQNGTIHLAYIIQGMGSHKLVWQKKEENKAWDMPITLSFDLPSPSVPVAVLENEKIFVSTISANKIFSYESDISNISWSQTYSVDLSNYPLSALKIIGLRGAQNPYVIGSITRKNISLLWNQDFLDNKLKLNIAASKGQDSESKAQSQQVEKYLKEIEKLKIMLSMQEDEIKRLKNLTSTLNNEIMNLNQKLEYYKNASGDNNAENSGKEKPDEDNDSITFFEYEEEENKRLFEEMKIDDLFKE